jgi:hypothetical protein
MEAERACALSDTEDALTMSPPIRSPNDGNGVGAGVIASPESAAKSSSPPASPTPPPRHRATSLLSRPDAAQQFLSPLAQVFAIPENPEEPIRISPNGPEGPLSFGIVSRKRRMSEAHKRVGSGSYHMPGVNAGGSGSSEGRPFPVAREGHRKASPRVTISSLPVAMGPDLHLATVGQIEEEEGDGIQAPGLVVTKRLDRIEERQQRIESLLEEIAKNLRH